MTILHYRGGNRLVEIESRLPLDADEFPAQAVDIVRSKFYPGEQLIEPDTKFQAALAIQKKALKTERKK